MGTKMRMRSRFMRSPDSEGGTSGPSEPTPSAAPAAPAPNTPAPSGGNQPPPVPYPVFKAANDKVGKLETDLAAARSSLAQHGPEAMQTLRQQLEAQKSESAIRVTLARSGVSSDMALDYLVARHGQLPEDQRGDVSGWVTGLRETEPAFFGGSVAAAAPAAPVSPDTTTQAPPAAPPSPDSTTVSPPSAAPEAHDAPLSHALLRDMDQATFERRWDEIEKWVATNR